LRHSTGEPLINLDKGSLQTSPAYNLPVGSYLVTYRKAMCADIQKSFYAEAGKSAEIVSPTNQEWESSKKSILRFISNVTCNLHIYQEEKGSKINVSSYILEKDVKKEIPVRAAIYKIKAEADGFREMEPKPIAINKGEDKNIEIILTKLPAPTEFETNGSMEQRISYQSNEPESFVAGYYYFINNKEFHSAYNMESPRYRRTMNFDRWFTELWEHNLSISLENKQLISINAHTAEVLVRLRSMRKQTESNTTEQNGVRVRVIYAIAKLVREGNYWYMDDFKGLKEEEYLQKLRENE
jgi:hypothetical protein